MNNDTERALQPTFRKTRHEGHNHLQPDSYLVQTKPHQQPITYQNNQRMRHHHQQCDAAAARYKYRPFYPLQQQSYAHEGRFLLTNVGSLAKPPWDLTNERCHTRQRRSKWAHLAKKSKCPRHDVVTFSCLNRLVLSLTRQISSFLCHQIQRRNPSAQELKSDL